jgi:plasmid stabilization system protein ParE
MCGPPTAFLATSKRSFFFSRSSPTLARPDIAPNLRYLPVRRYLILYRETAGGIEIVRVVHGARDVPAPVRDT